MKAVAEGDPYRLDLLVARGNGKKLAEQGVDEAWTVSLHPRRRPSGSSASLGAVQRRLDQLCDGLRALLGEGDG